MGSRLAIRKKMRTRRRALSEQSRSVAARQLAYNVAHSYFFKTGFRIACYLPNDGEIDPHPIIRKIWKMRKICYLPVLSSPYHNHMCFAPYQTGDKLIKNEFGIPEPAVSPRALIPARQLDVVFAPLVAFDLSGNRLGMGGGYYDKTFSFLTHRTKWRKPHLVGIAYDFQQVGNLDHFPWDVPLGSIITDHNEYIIG